jgi:epoxyqueuosine reductase
MSKWTKRELEEVLEKIRETGFDFVSFTRPLIPEADQKNVEIFIRKGFPGEMKWFAERQNIRIGWENLGFSVGSVFVFGSVYCPTEEDRNKMGEWQNLVSKYAWGMDYHSVLRERSKGILEWLRSRFPESKFRQSSDSLPIAEKVLGREAKLGWIGKNTLLIHPEFGSYFFIGIFLSDRKLGEEIPSDPTEIPGAEKWGIFGDTNRCGTCRACMDACPTGAIFEEYKMDPRLCLSYQTIESKSEHLPQEFDFGTHVYGCDICQDVCPWNRVKAKKKGVVRAFSEFSPIPVFQETVPGDWIGMEGQNPTGNRRLVQNQIEKSVSQSDRESKESGPPAEEEFVRYFQSSAIGRIGAGRWIRNLRRVFSQFE